MIDVSRVKKLQAQIPDSDLLIEGIGLLYQAYQYALDVSRDPWEFAVGIGELRAVGMTNADCRWLLCKGYLQHAREIRSEKGDHRKFVFGSHLYFRNRSCFQLTEQGVKLAEDLFGDSRAALSLWIAEGLPQVQAQHHKSQPKWDGELHQFFVDDQLVKEFKVPSPNQEMILTAFQEEGWPKRIDDPLAPSARADGKRRLHDTIKSLNRNQKQNLIRFIGDGTGEGVRWELIIP